MSRLKSILFVLASLIALAAQAAEPIATIRYKSGLLMAKHPDGSTAILNLKSEVQAGDILMTGDDSFAMVAYSDGGAMTLRPNSHLKVEQYHFKKEEPKADNAVFKLVKGGFRTVTGLIGKRENQKAYSIRAQGATIGIRGTDFDVRLCKTQGCKDNAVAKTDDKEESRPDIAARIVKMEGDVSSLGTDGVKHKLVTNSPLYAGERIYTSAKSSAVIVFKDEGKITLQPSSQIKLDEFSFQNKPNNDNVVISLIKGGARVASGLIGHVRHDRYKFRMATTTIGIRGTGFDAWCNGPCAEEQDDTGATPESPLDGAGVYVWSGEIDFTGKHDTLIVAENQSAIISRGSGKTTLLNSVPTEVLRNPSEKPTAVPVDMDKLFKEESSEGEPGVYVSVHDGVVAMDQGQDHLEVGRGETGFAGADKLMRLDKKPDFISQTHVDAKFSQHANPSINQSGCLEGQ